MFEDKTQKIYNTLIEEYKEEQRQLENQYAKMEYSTYVTGDNGENKREVLNNWFDYEQQINGESANNRSFLIQIENSDSYTKVTFKFRSLYNKQRLGISDDTYIEDLNTHKKYKLIDAANINILSSNRYVSTSDFSVVGKGVVEYILFFERIPEETRHIQIIERYLHYGKYKNGWEYKDVVLKPYGRKDLYVFEDKTNIEKSNTDVYYIDFKNNHSDPRDVYVNDKYIGRVAGYGHKTFTVSTSIYGTLKSIQASGYLIFPNEESFYISKKNNGTTVNISN